MPVWAFPGQPGSGITFPGAQREGSVPPAGCRRRWRALGSARRVLQAGSIGPSHRKALKVQESTEGQCTEYKICYTLQEPVSVLEPRGEQSYSKQDQFTLSGVFTREKGL